MENNQEQKNIRETILGKIIRDEIKMRPRFFFVLRFILLVFVIIIVLVTSVLICNFIAFSIRVNGHDTLLTFGFSGVERFLLFFPWLYLLIDVAFIGFLEWLVRRFEFGYKIPILHLLCMILLPTLFISVFIDRGTPFNDNLFNQAREHHLPGSIGGFYEHAHKPHKPGSGFCKCTIINIDEAGFSAEDRDFGENTPITVIVPEDNPHIDYNSIYVGNVVFVAGDSKDGFLYAFGIAPLPDFSHN